MIILVIALQQLPAVFTYVFALMIIAIITAIIKVAEK